MYLAWLVATILGVTLQGVSASEYCSTMAIFCPSYCCRPYGPYTTQYCCSDFTQSINYTPSKVKVTYSYSPIYIGCAIGAVIFFIIILIITLIKCGCMCAGRTGIRRRVMVLSYNQNRARVEPSVMVVNQEPPSYIQVQHGYPKGIQHGGYNYPADTQVQYPPYVPPAYEGPAAPPYPMAKY